jgi:3-oxoacyl-[acyl-carrier-protein] synthase II
MVTPLGGTADVTWKNILEGKSGANKVTDFKIDDVACQIAAQIPRGSSDEGNFNPDDWMEVKEQRKVDDFILYAIAAADQALADSGWKPMTYEDQTRSGVLIGSGIGGLQGIEQAAHILAEKGPRRVSPFFIPGRLINLAGGYVSIRHGLKGPEPRRRDGLFNGRSRHWRRIAADCLSAMPTSWSLAVLNRRFAVCLLSGFAACRALSTGFNDDPERGSRPYDTDRDGFVMGEGAGIVVLEEYEHAVARGAKIYAEVVGYGLSGDAYHITAPSMDGDGAYRCMEAALNRAGLTAADVDYVNAHGTSTPLGDEIELGAVTRLAGDHAPNLTMSSTKSSIGHLLGAAGAVEAIFSVLAIRDGIAPPTINLDNPSVETEIDLVAHKAKQMNIDVALSNSFGFGGTNASLVFRKVAA